MQKNYYSTKLKSKKSDKTLDSYINESDKMKSFKVLKVKFLCF